MHYVFRKGQWRTVELPYSDPILTPDHKQWAAAIVATEIVKGTSQQEAELLAEKRLYERIYGIAVPIAASKDRAGTA